MYVFMRDVIIMQRNHTHKAANQVIFDLGYNYNRQEKFKVHPSDVEPRNLV